MTPLTLALSKGRILDDTLPLLARMGVTPAGDIGRLLRVPTNVPGL
ncbi:MAG TPA: ATP phosphoribosyltransferase, partial [Nevskiaceae bacterium]|nr:ATP phosphoribosyltransferase [Nevskiaceae bacterium]